MAIGQVLLESIYAGLLGCGLCGKGHQTEAEVMLTVYRVCWVKGKDGGVVGRRKGVLCKGLEVGGGAIQSWRNWKLFHPDWGRTGRGQELSS